MTARLAYAAGLCLAPIAILIAIFVINERGPQECNLRGDVTFSSHRVVVEHCTGRLGLSTREPQIVARLD